MGAPSTTRQRVWESPWYWLHVFCIASLGGLVIVGPKFVERQAGVERKFQGRQRASFKNAGQEPTTELSTPDNLHVRLLPLYALFGLGAIVAWIQLWRTHYQGGRWAHRPTNQQAEDQGAEP